MKAKSIKLAKKFTDIPNVGKRIEKDLLLLGFRNPKDLVGSEGFKMYVALCKKTKTRHDPCLLDTFLAIADFANGGSAKKWYRFTKERKATYSV